jgi:hypothetical protein
VKLSTTLTLTSSAPISVAAWPAARGTATFQVAIQAALDIASHIVSDRRLGEPRTNQALCALLQQDHWLSHAPTATMHKMVGFRNVGIGAGGQVGLGDGHPLSRGEIE